MNFTLQRNKTVVSMSGLSVEFVKGVSTYVPPHMYQEVMAVGAVPDEELDLEPKLDVSKEPGDPVERQKAIFGAFETIVKKGRREDFTAAGAPHGKVLSQMLGWTVTNKERDLAWVAFQNLDEK